MYCGIIGFYLLCLTFFPLSVSLLHILAKVHVVTWIILMVILDSFVCY